MRFADPIFLVFALSVPILGVWWAFLRARREKSLSNFVSPQLRKKLLPEGSDFWSAQATFILIGLALAFFAAARPQWGKTSEKRMARSRNVVVALDVSRSMLAEDVLPNRLERAKADIADLVDSLQGDRCALVAFRKTGALVCPLTTDYGFLRGTLARLSIDSAPRGETDLGSAIRSCLDALDPAADDHNAIIIISDGGDLRGKALEGAELAAKRGIPIFTVGIGDPKNPTALPGEDGKTDFTHNGSVVKVKLEESSLKSIAEASKGKYIPLATAGTVETTLGTIYRKFLRSVAVKEQNEEESHSAERFYFFLLPALVFLIAGVSLSKGRFSVKRSKSKKWRKTTFNPEKMI